MKLTILLCLILITTYSHIYSSDSRVVYDYSGTPLYYRIFLSLETGLGSNDYLKINWPLKVHSATDKSVVKANLISFSNNLQIATTSFQNYPSGSTDTLYYITFGVALTPLKWYQIQIYPNYAPAVALPFYGMIQIQAISSLNANAIVYDSNYAFGYITVQSALAATGTMSVAVSTTSASANIPAAIYKLNIQVTPTITSELGGNFTMYIYYDSSNILHTASGSGLLDFSFMGLCQSVTPSVGTAAILNGCQISSDLTTITFSLNRIDAGQKIRIQTQVSNPLYVSQRGIRVYYVDFVSGIVKENGYLTPAVQVNAIPITDLGATRVYLLWGISPQYIPTDSQLTSLNLGLYKGSGVNVGPFNSFNCGFSFTQTSPISGRYTVKMYLGATGFLQGSVAHNLPAYSSLKVYCNYNNVTMYLVCDNVGPFINLNYRYFISGKAYYSSSVSGSSISGFGDVIITPVVFNSAGTQLTAVTLYDPLTSGDSINLVTSNQYLDTSGYHSTNNYKIGVARIVSFQDDGTLSSTANAMKNLMTGTNTTVGIVPDLGISQQLLLLMKVATVSGGTGNAYKFRMLYNNKVIGFQSGGQSRGLDFVGYDSTNAVWSISYSPCFITGNVVCQKYNNDTPTYNVQVRNNGTSGKNFYGLYKFDCGLAYTASPNCVSGNCATACNLFTGYGTADRSAGVMSMRKVTFPSTSFHSSVYADQNLLDFVVIFQQASTAVATPSFVGASLINAYTMVGTKMQNIKASYVNYFDFDATNYNKGQRIPTMIRISGGVLPSQSRNATAVGVFFDDCIDASTFYTYENQARDVGCSTGSCLYYPNTNVFLFPNDAWPTMRRVQVYNLPAIQNQFNILIPVTPLFNRYSYSSNPLPYSLTLAFFTRNYSIGDATGLLQTVSVYRLFGTVVTGSIVGAITTINGLVQRGSNSFSTYLSVNGVGSYSGTSLGYYLNTTNINSNPPNNTFVYGYTGSFTFNNQYGCGVTLTSLYYNIFSSSTVAFENPPANTATTCSLFGYVYNQQTPGQNPSRDGQWIYTAFCPIDANISLGGPDGNIHFKNPQYPSVFTTNFALNAILTYGISSPQGQLVHYKHQTTAISSFVRTCTTSKPDVYNPATVSSGRQRSKFIVSTPQIRMAPAGTYNGYSNFQVVITLPTMSNILMETTSSANCLISDPKLSCSVVGTSTNAQVTVTYIGTGVMTVTYFELQLYATTTGSLGAGGDYTLTIFLPQYQSSVVTNFGSSLSSKITYCTCTSNFKIGNTPYGQTMTFQAPVTTTTQLATKSWYNFNFGSYDYREAFFSTSYYQFSFGFLTDPSSTDRTANNFRCMIYQNQQGTLSLSNLFSYIDLSNFASVKLYPKGTINQPNTYLFTMGCYGSGVPTGSNTTAMTLSWIDNAISIQSGSPISYPSTFTSVAPSTLSATLASKRFNTQGMKAFYSFTLTTSSLTRSSRIYLNFHFKLNSKLDNEGYVECYLRASLAGTPIFTYCEFTQDRQLAIWNNLLITTSTTIYIDIYNIQVPKSTDTSPNQITISLDLDSDYSNGVSQKVSISDTASSNNAISNIIITSTSMNPTFIRTPQTITIKFDTVTTTVLTSGSCLYLLLPGAYGQWIDRGKILSVSTQCKLEIDNALGSNKLSACQFISKRILKMTLSASTNYRYHTITLTGLYSPSKVPADCYNQYRFKLFTTSNTATEPDINRFSFTDLSKHLTLQPDDTLIDLNWKYYQISISDSLVNLVDRSSQTFIIYIGYFSNVIELRQSLYPSNFILEMTLSLSNYLATDFIHKDGSTIKLGYQNTYYRIAASTTIAAGLYTLQYTKAGDTNNKYTAVPPLTVVVSNALCKLATKQTSYSLPKGGMTVPIQINAIGCIPITDITITPTFSSSQVTMVASLSSNVLTPTSKDGQVYIVARHNGTLAIGSIVTVTFTITGTQSAYFDTISSVNISIVDALPFQTLPTASALSTPTQSYNRATFILQCSMASRIYWGLGIYPSILNSQALDFEARIISGATGLLTNFTQPQDYYMRVYGVNYVTTTQTLSKSLYNLKSNSQYIFKYYCVNQMGLISDGQSFIFNSLNYGAYLMKVSIIFQGAISYQQYSDLSCSLALTFQVPYARVMTQAMSVCGGSITPFYTATTETIIKQANTNGQYVYNFYILPDYTIPIDNTNANIRSALTLSSTSTTIITTTANSVNLPTFVQMQTEDIQFFSLPTLTVSSPISGLNSIVVTASITNMNGFIVIGCMNGLFTSSMTYPTASYIKKGFLSQNVTLNQVKMIYAIQNYNISFQFSGLASSTGYSCFYFATTEDPQISAASTDVGTFNAQTLQALIIDINYAWKTNNALWAVLLLIFIMWAY